MSSTGEQQPDHANDDYGVHYEGDSAHSFRADFVATAEAAAPAASGSEDDVINQLASQYLSFTRSRSRSAPIPPTSLSSTWGFSDTTSTQGSAGAAAPLPPALNVNVIAPVLDTTSSIGAIGSQLAATTINDLASLHHSEPENEPTLGADMAAAIASAVASGAPLPATFLRTICDQLEFYFCDDNLLNDLFLLKNMNMEGYVKLDLLASFGRVKKLTTDLEQIRKSLELSTKLLMNEDETMVCRKEPLPANQTYHGKLARTAIAYNLPEDASVASLRETFSQCGEISYLRLLKKNATTGRNAVLKPPIIAGETYAIIEFIDDEMTKHAVLTLTDSYNRDGLQVVLFDGTNADRLKQKMFPVEVGERRRAKSASVATRPVHVDSVGEGLEDLKEGKVNTGIVYSIRGAGGLITPTRLDTACISFRLIPDEDGNMDIRPGDYVSFTVGKNKKSGRKYASKVKLEFRPPSALTNADLNIGSSSASQSKDYFGGSPGRWESRNRSATVGAPPGLQNFRGRSGSSGSRPKLTLSSPRMGSSPPSHSFMGNAATTPTSASAHFRQALGPDGTRGFGSRRTGEPEVVMTRKNSFTGSYERRRSHSATTH